MRRRCTIIGLILVMAHAAPARDVSDFRDKIEGVRSDLRIPGIALVVVQNDRVVFADGLGLRDVEGRLPVTPDTLFAIGSCTKAFTAMAAAIAQEEGKLSLDDSPKKYIPGFKLVDPEADEKITLRDMLCHRSGLGATDLAWATGTLNRDEVIQVACSAKPTAKFREKFQYQNVMYSAAGQAAARACGVTWEQLITAKILDPLGMKSSKLSVEQMQKTSDFSRGYSYDMQSKETRLVPTRDLTNIAPAGAINSSAREMAQWLRLMLNRGKIDGRQIVSQKLFDELTTTQVDIGGGTGYAMGWVVHEWRGTRVLQHSGGIDGFNAFVVVFPDKQLAYALLTNVSASPIDASVRPIIWDHFVGAPAAPATSPAAAGPAVDPKTEVGKYGILDIVWRDNSLWAIVAGQPDYKLESLGGRKYKLANAPPGFFVTFRPAKNDPGDVEVYLEQPQGNVTFALAPSDETRADATARYSGPHKDLLGRYEIEGFTLEITSRGDKLVALVEGQPPYTLREVDKDTFRLDPLPESFELQIRRDATDKVTGAFLKQPRPQPDLELTRAVAPASQESVDEIVKMATEAAGGEDNLHKHRTLKMTYTMILENQGMSGTGELIAHAPDASTRVTSFIALGKTVGTITETFDGTTGKVEGSFVPSTPFNQQQIGESKALSDFHGPAGWKRQFKTITHRGKVKVGGDDCDKLELQPESGPRVTVFISEKTHLIMQRDFTRTGEGAAEPVSELYTDWRDVGGVKLPFRMEQKSALGKLVTIVESAAYTD